MLLANRAHPERFRSMCALAPAVDWDAEFLLPGIAGGNLDVRGDDVMVGIAPVPKSLIDSMARHRVLDAPFRIGTPLHIIHGDLDREASPAVAERLCRHVSGGPCSIERLPHEDHSVAKLGTKASQSSFERWLYHEFVAAKVAR